MWAELAAATADWTPAMWLGASGGAAGAVYVAGTALLEGRDTLHDRAQRAKWAAEDAHASMRAQRAKWAADDRFQLTVAPGPRDWCRKCDHIRLRMEFRWADDGASWVCRWCAAGEPPPEGQCDCQDCEVFGQNAAHRPPKVVPGSLAEQVTAEAAARRGPRPPRDGAITARKIGDGGEHARPCPCPRHNEREQRVFDANGDSAPLGEARYAAAIRQKWEQMHAAAQVPPAQVGNGCDGRRGNHGDPLVVCGACCDTPWTDEEDDAWAIRQYEEPPLFATLSEARTELRRLGGHGGTVTKVVIDGRNVGFRVRPGARPPNFKPYDWGSSTEVTG